MFGYNKTFKVEGIIPGSVNKVWDILAFPGGFTRFHPFLKEHCTEAWGTIGNKDKVVYFNGMSYERELIKWEEGKRFDVRMTENGKFPLTLSFRCIPIDKYSSKIVYVMNADFLKQVPFPLRWLMLELQVKPVFTKYLCHVHKGLEFYAKTGFKVKRNQFGSHSTFSPEYSDAKTCIEENPFKYINSKLPKGATS